MTQLNIVSAEVGWGSLKSNISTAQEILKDVARLEKDLHEKKVRLTASLHEINTLRRERVLALLKAEDRSICLLHQFIFPENGIEESLAFSDGVSLVRIVRSWTESERYYDSERTYTDHSDEIDLTACKNCRQVVSNGSYSSGNYTNRLAHGRSPKVADIESLYTDEILDKVSKEYYGMISVDSVSDLESL